jgi:nucleoside-diphosphate-sugar epimerase
MRILILGAGGFIGSNLVVAAASRGSGVVALARGGFPSGQNVAGLAWSLGEAVPEAACRNIDCAIHLAHDFDGEEGAHRTLVSTVATARQLRDAGVRRQLFFSSYSAGEHASSLYGRTKLAIEKELSAIAGVVIVRPGLVLGDGGIYGRIRKWARLVPIIPLPDGGRGRLPVIDIARLCEETLRIAGRASTEREENLFENEQRSLRQLVLEAAEEAGRHPWIVPVPSNIVYLVLKAAGFLRIDLPVNADNLAGFLGNQAASHRSTLR